MKKVICFILLTGLLLFAGCSGKSSNTVEPSFNSSSKPSQNSKPSQTPIRIKGTFVELYTEALDSFIALDKGLNGGMKFISIDTGTLKYLPHENRKIVLKFFDKYKVDIMDASFGELEAKGLFNEKQYSLDGILLSVKEITIVSDDEVIIEGEKYRGGDGAIGVKANMIYKSEKWHVEEAGIIWIS